MYQNAHLWLGNLDLIIVFPCHPLRSRVLASRHGENWGGRSKHFVFGTLLHTRSQTYCGFLLLQRHTMSWGRSKGTREWKVKTLHDTILTYCHPPFVQFVHKVTSALGRHGSSFINLKEASKEAFESDSFGFKTRQSIYRSLFATRNQDVYFRSFISWMNWSLLLSRSRTSMMAVPCYFGSAEEVAIFKKVSQ